MESRSIKSARNAMQGKPLSRQRHPRQHKMQPRINFRRLQKRLPSAPMESEPQAARNAKPSRMPKQGKPSPRRHLRNLRRRKTNQPKKARAKPPLQLKHHRRVGQRERAALLELNSMRTGAVNANTTRKTADALVQFQAYQAIRSRNRSSPFPIFSALVILPPEIDRAHSHSRPAASALPTAPTSDHFLRR